MKGRRSPTTRDVRKDDDSDDDDDGDDDDDDDNFQSHERPNKAEENERLGGVTASKEG